MTNKQITKKLEVLRVKYSTYGDDYNKLKAWVIEDVLDGADPDYINSYMTDVLEHGCISGCVGSLIYYKDTRAFYDRFYNEIEDLRYNMSQDIGEDINPPSDQDSKNWLAWFGYEKTMRELVSEVGIDW